MKENKDTKYEIKTLNDKCKRKELKLMEKITHLNEEIKQIETKARESYEEKDIKLTLEINWLGNEIKMLEKI